MLKPHYLLAFGVALSFAACENEVNLLQDVPATPIVYGLYNHSNTEQVLSLTKTFRFAEGGGALESAATADSVYYDNELVSVVIESTTGDQVIAERYSAAAEGVERNAGVFPNDPNFYYRYDATSLGLEPGDSFDLRVSLEGNAEPIAQVRQVVMPELGFPRSRVPPTSYPLTANNRQTLSWTVTESNLRNLVAVYEVGFIIAFYEESSSGRVARELYYPAVRDIFGATNTDQINYAGVYDFLRASLDVDPNITRRFRYMQLIITGGDDSFSAYQELLEANDGITSTQELPPFSNVEGAVGLFGSVTQFRQDTLATLTSFAFDGLYGLNGDEYGVAELNFRP